MTNVENALLRLLGGIVVLLGAQALQDGVQRVDDGLLFPNLSDII